MPNWSKSDLANHPKLGKLVLNHGAVALKAHTSNAAPGFPNKDLDILETIPDSENFCPACNKSGVIENPKGFHNRCGGKLIPVGLARKNNGLHIVIVGKIMGGKNNICITRTGHRFPNKKWAAWRDDAVAHVKLQVAIQHPRFETITAPVNVRMTYVAGDRRRRDMPAIIDAVFHVFEKAGIVSDDTLLWVSESSRSYDKDAPRCEITFLKL